MCNRILSLTFALALAAMVTMNPALGEIKKTAANAAVTVANATPDKFAIGTTGSIKICLGAGGMTIAEDARIAGTGVTLTNIAQVGSTDCMTADFKVDASAVVGKRMIEIKETGGSFKPAGYEIEITATPPVAQTSPIGPIPAPKPTVDPEIVKLRGEVAAMKLTIEGICSADSNWRKEAWGSRRGSSTQAGADCRKGIIKSATEATREELKSLTDGVRASLDKLDNNLPAESTVRGWATDAAKDAVKPVKDKVDELATKVEEHGTTLTQLRTDLDANTDAVKAVKERAEELRKLMFTKGTRGEKNALRTPATPAPAKAKAAPATAAFTAAQP